MTSWIGDETGSITQATTTKFIGSINWSTSKTTGFGYLALQPGTYASSKTVLATQRKYALNTAEFYTYRNGLAVEGLDLLSNEEIYGGAFTVPLPNTNEGLKLPTTRIVRYRVITTATIRPQGGGNVSAPITNTGRIGIHYLNRFSTTNGYDVTLAPNLDPNDPNDESQFVSNYFPLASELDFTIYPDRWCFRKDVDGESDPLAVKRFGEFPFIGEKSLDSSVVGGLQYRFVPFVVITASVTDLLPDESIKFNTLIVQDTEFASDGTRFGRFPIINIPRPLKKQLEEMAAWRKATYAGRFSDDFRLPDPEYRANTCWCPVSSYLRLRR